ncbi:CASP8-associated protein 2 isoform X2 [Pseudophryne corroboree]|uniref:CASP8-associated protein 2 isoform X2 n=1 Tax=Pseudophryne corroboree TaxID=495146 RepID=UPI0030814CFD
MMHFQDLYASPAKSDASSVDIYDGLDTDTLTVEFSKPSSPSRDCLDLYEEIITEEGTAKEASLNDLSAEYEKSQRQLKQLISKLKEMQSMNTSLQNENQCLKKNISALIKTARVEITRKEEEINRLNQRLFTPGNTRNVKSVPVLLQSVNKTKLKEDTASKITRDEDCIRKEVDSSKDVSLNLTPINNSEKVKACVENTSSLSTAITQYVKQCKESAPCPLQKQSFALNTETDKKNRKEMDSVGQIKDSEQRQRKEGHRSSISSSTSENSVVKEKTRPISKCGKREGYQSKNSKLDVWSDTESRKTNSSSHDKSSATKDKVELREPLHSKEKPITVYEKSSSSKDAKVHGRETNLEHRRRAAEKDNEPRRSNRKHFSNVEDESYQKALFEKNGGRSSNDARRREKLASEYTEAKRGNKDSKSSKTDHNTSSTNGKHNHEKKSDKSDLKRRGHENKRSREEHNRNKHDQKHRGLQKGDTEVCESSSKDQCEEQFHKTDMHSMNCEKDLLGQKEDHFQKDLKLSFMETLSLTLSPAKKKSDTDPTTSTVSNIECGVVEEDLTTDLSFQVCVSIENITNAQKTLNSPKQMDSKHQERVSWELPTKTVTLDDTKLVCLSEPVADNMECLQEEPPTSTHDDNIAALANMTLEDSHVVATELDAVSSEEMVSVVDGSVFIDLESFIEIDKCSGSESPNSENLNVSLPTEHAQEGGALDQACEDVDKTSNLKPNITETTKDQPSDVHTTNPGLSLSMELNKENCEPVKTNLCSEFPIEISSDEVEEGEIVSEEEVVIGEQALQSISSTSQTNLGKESTVSKITSSLVSELISLSNAKTPKHLVSKMKKKEKNLSQTKSSPVPTAKRIKPTADSCLEGVLKIIPPSSIQDVLQMLRIIRKHIRKKYMKFKIQFPVTQFHRIIEAATLCFITLVSNLDWSNLCSSPQRLQNKLCKHIEYKLKQMKKNGIVDRIFDQRLIDMKKRLWKFVEEQLDSLFDTIKDILLKRCDMGKIENDRDEQKNKTASCARTQKSDHIKNSKKSSNLKTKACLAQSVSVPCLRQLEFCSRTNVSNTKLQSADDTSVGNKLLKDSVRVGCLSEHGNTVFNNISPPSKYSPHSTGKTVLSNGLQKGQQNSTGLSFNLVSDDHMGDIFKSLLHDPNQLEINALQENLWLYGTPEKQCSSNQKYESVDSMVENKTPTKAHFSWSSISPPHINTLPRLETVLNPDVFDESCLLEIPTSKCLTSTEERLSSYSSVLLEDLAVSLTVPSPLKSDSHLSFLRPVCDGESLSDVNAHCNEDALLEEEDAIEQDIHLTLDSDNSCTDSLDNVGEPGSFHCHPSEPMQAVIMEKSNDHFIVKIRRAVSSSSPLSDSSSVDETDNTSSRQLETVECSAFSESAQRDVEEMEALADAKTKAHSDSVVPCTVDSSLSDIEKSVETSTCPQPDSKSPSEAMESVFKTPEKRSQNSTCTLETTNEIEVTDATSAENGPTDSDKSYREKTISLPVICPGGLPLNPNSDCMDFSLAQKKRKGSNEKHSSKRAKLSSSYDTKAKSKSPRQSKPEEGSDLLVTEKSHRKHKQAVRDGTINSEHSPSSMPAKNVVKKKGEVVVSWTRDEDRAILLECQKLGPKEKTFFALSSKMNKYPHQVEERFRQLMKLFKKSRNCSS